MLNTSQGFTLMPTYIIRPASGLFTHVEYTSALKKEVSQKTEEILSEAVLAYENLTGTLSPGLELTEAESGAVGKVLWAKGTAAKGEIGLGELTAPFEGSQDVTGEEVSFDGKSVTNPIEREAATPEYATFLNVEDFNTDWTEAQVTHYVDVRHTEKLILTNIATSGFIRACNRVATNPLSVWIGPGKSAEIHCAQRLFRLLLILSAEGLPYVISAIGEGTGLYKNLAPRSLTPPETTSRSVISDKSSRSRKTTSRKSTS